MSTTDNFTSTCFEHPKNEKYESQNGKNTSEANEKKKQKKKRKKIITKRLQIGTTRTEIIRIKRMFIFLATVSLKN